MNTHETRLASYRKALEHPLPEKEKANLSYAIGCILMQMGLYAEAVDCFDTALRGGVGKARWNKCLSLLHKGDWVEGMRLYSSRRDPGSPDAVTFPELPLPFASALEELRGKRVLVLNEQGFGDDILFSRALPIARSISEMLFVKCHPSLRTLFQASMPAIQFFDEHSMDVISSTPLDCWISTGDLFAMNCTAEMPFQPVCALTTTTAKTLPCKDGKTANIGICWTCNPKSANYSQRSLQLNDIQFLHSLANATCFSFQRGEAPAPEWMVDLSTELVTFADTAAYLKQMDFVISVDSALAHLAGAMKLPGMLAHGAYVDWRWKYLDSDNFSKLYPTIMVGGIQELHDRVARGFT